MSVKKGDYLGGIRTVEDLKARSVVDEITGCWVWGLSRSHGYPSVAITINGKHVRHRGRRAAAIVEAGMVDLPKGHMAWAHECCNNTLCVNPAHVRTGPQAKCKKELAERGVFKGNPGVLANGYRQAEKRLAKITKEQAEEIRFMKAPIAEIAERFGICKSNVHLIRAGKTWRDQVTKGASVFNWRPK